MTVFGFLNIDKPSGLTSHDVVARLRRGLKIKKMGHAGTLDPMATGVLVICVGAATRLSEYVMHTAKTYEARIRLGITTDTYDADGVTIAEQDASHVTEADVTGALARFTGEIEQMPPMYSAIKVGGKKLYELAREGQTIERQPRRVNIESLEVVDWSLPEFTLRVTCGAGTYIRSLAYDVGEALGVGAHLKRLTRTASGSFTLENALALDTVLESDGWQQYLISPAHALKHIPAVHFDDAAINDLLHGRTVTGEPQQAVSLAQAYGPDGQFVAIIEGDGERWHPRKVFNAGVEQ